MDSRALQMSKSRSVLPAYDEVPVQMSPFGDDRWDLDVEENRRRKEIHREYVYNINQRRPAPLQPAVQECAAGKPQRPDPNVQCPQVVAEVLDVCESAQKQPEPEKDFFKYEPPKAPPMKTLSDIKFDTPSPPNLFPVLKFPEKKFDSSNMYRLSDAGSFVAPVAGVRPPPEPLELPPKPQFSTFREIKFEKEKVVHYGVHVPFWQFANKSNVPS